VSTGDPQTPCACGCCQGTGGPAPVLLPNRPGLSALVYRVGTHSKFKSAMLGEISAKHALQALATRADDDPAIALLDAWAVSLDVLTFYQERIANEGFLRTATERRSLLELARTIGYELRPGVAASTWLAFTLDGSPGSPREVTVPAGTRAQSLPTKSELPQSFETSADLVARPDWNALLPKRLTDQTVASGATTLFLDGVATQLRPGDAVLILAADAKSGDLRILTEVDAQTTAAVTRVAWREALTIATVKTPTIYALRQRAALFGANAPDWKGMTFDFKNAYVTSLGKPALDPKAPQDWPKDWPDAETVGDATSIDLDAAYPRIAPQSWVMLKAGDKTRLFTVNSVDTVTRSAFSLSARVSRLSVELVEGDGDFGMRETAVYAQSEELALAQQVVTNPVSGKTIDLDGLVGGLVHGRAVIVQGQRMRARVDIATGSTLPLKAEDGSGVVELQPGETLEVLAQSVQGLATTWHLRDRDGFEGSITLSPGLTLAAALSPAVVDQAAITGRAVSALLQPPIVRQPSVTIPGGGFRLPPVLADQSIRSWPRWPSST
jgi:hypothetical protein